MFKRKLRVDTMAEMAKREPTTKECLIVQALVSKFVMDDDEVEKMDCDMYMVELGAGVSSNEWDVLCNQAMATLGSAGCNVKLPIRHPWAMEKTDAPYEKYMADSMK